MSRQLDDWLSSYLRATEKQESPPMFHLFCGLFAISAALGRKIWLNRGTYKIYPNIYVILVGGTGVVRKTAAIDIATNVILDGIEGVEICAQKTTPEALITNLNKKYQSTGRSEAIIIAEELGVFLGNDVRNLALVEFLTKLYNCPNKLDYDTKGRGHEVCNLGCCCLLGGTTPEWLVSALPQGATEGGFSGRVLFVYANETGKRIYIPEMDPNVWLDLKGDLNQISKLSGEIKFDDRALEYIRHWYEKEFRPDERFFEGYNSRVHDHVAKIAMLLSVSKRDTLTIQELDVVGALQYIRLLEQCLPMVKKALTKSQEGIDQEKVLDFIRKAGKGGIQYTRLLQRLSHKYNAQTIRLVLSSLSEAGMITQENELIGGACIIKLKEFQE